MEREEGREGTTAVHRATGREISRAAEEESDCGRGRKESMKEQVCDSRVVERGSHQGPSSGSSSWWCEAPTVAQSVVKGVERTLGEMEEGLRRLVGRRGILGSDSVKMVGKDL